jgi:hypothetical protein
MSVETPEPADGDAAVETEAAVGEGAAVVGVPDALASPPPST